VPARTTGIREAAACHAVGVERIHSALAARRGLGSLQGEFRRRPERVNGFLGPVFALVPLVVLVAVPHKPGIAALIALPCWLFSAIALPLSPPTNRRLGVQRYYLFDGGLVFVTARKRPVTFVWDDIAAVYERITQSGWTIPHWYRIQGLDGRELAIPPRWENSVALGTAVAARVCEAQPPDAREALARGEALHFGASTISTAGVLVGKRTIPWSEIREVRLRRIRVKSSGFF
jgi:hypothetical protein